MSWSREREAHTESWEGSRKAEVVFHWAVAVFGM